MKKLLVSVLLVGSLVGSFATVVEAKAKASSYGPMAQCRDGTYSYSKNHRGTCSWHGGVRVWFR